MHLYLVFGSVVLLGLFHTNNADTTGSQNAIFPGESPMRLFGIHSDLERLKQPFQGEKFTRLAQRVLSRFDDGTKRWITKVLAAPPREVNPTCLLNIGQALVAANNSEMWGIRYLDSMGRAETGVLYGNTRWTGSFDECIETVSNITSGKQFKGHYCKVQVETINGPLIWDIGFCLPESCSKEDLLILANEYRNSTGEIPVESTECFSYPNFSKDGPAIAATVVLSVFGGLALIATIVDYFIVFTNRLKSSKTKNDVKIGGQENGVFTISQDDVMNKKPHLTQAYKEDNKYKPGLCMKLLLAFSFYSNIPKMMSTRQPRSALRCVNGIRVFTTTWIILAHTYGDMNTVRVANLVQVANEWSPRFALQVIVNAWLSVDTFFLLSGLLTCYLFMRMMDRQRGKVKAFTMIMYYVHRYVRLTPVMMIIVMILACYNQYYGYGPHKEQKQLDINCRTQWWRNLIYINNFPSKQHVGTQLCFLNGWYLPVDFQMYIIAPLVFIPLYKFPIIGTILAFLLLCVHFIANAVINSKVFGPDGSFDGVTDMVDVYFAPWCRVGPYAIGIMIGYVCYRTKLKCKLHPLFVIAGWLVSIFLGVALVYARFEVFKKSLGFFGKPWNRHFTIFYETVYRPAWALAVGWMIFACVHGYGGIINIFLSWKLWVPFGKLSYCVYLFHGITQRLYWQNGKRTVSATDVMMIWDYVGYVIMTFLIAIPLSGIFEMPIGVIEEILVGNKRRGGETRKTKIKDEQEQYVAELTKLPEFLKRGKQSWNTSSM